MSMKLELRTGAQPLLVLTVRGQIGSLPEGDVAGRTSGKCCYEIRTFCGRRFFKFRIWARLRPYVQNWNCPSWVG